MNPLLPVDPNLHSVDIEILAIDREFVPPYTPYCLISTNTIAIAKGKHAHQRTDSFYLPKLSPSDLKYLSIFHPGDKVKIFFDSNFVLHQINDYPFTIYLTQQEKESEKKSFVSMDSFDSPKGLEIQPKPQRPPKFTIALAHENGRVYRDVLVLDSPEIIMKVEEFLQSLHHSRSDPFYTQMIASLK